MEREPMNVEVLYFTGCPNHKTAVDRVKEALRAEGLPGAVAEIEVPDAETAQRLRFLGSPSIRVNGVDIEPDARSLTAFGMMCRTYSDVCCQSGLPSRELILSALREAPAPVSEPERRGASMRRSFMFGGSLIAGRRRLALLYPAGTGGRNGGGSDCGRRCV
jgi:hypothetical protein